MSIRPTSSQRIWLWPVLLVVSALAALGYLAARGISAGQEAMLANLRAELGRQMNSLLDAATREPLEGALLYPLALAPAAPNEDQQTYESAMASDGPVREKLLARIRDSTALTPGGLPLSPLVRLEMCRLAANKETLATRISDFARHIVRECPSLITPRLLAEAEALAHERSFETSSASGWGESLEAWRIGEPLRDGVRRASLAANCEIKPGWVHTGEVRYPEAWAMGADESPSHIRLISVQEILAKRAKPVARALASYAQLGVVAEVSFNGRNLLSDGNYQHVNSEQLIGPGHERISSRSRSESLARGERDGLVINCLLANPEQFRAEYWRQASVTIAIIVVALAAVAIGLWTMLRSLARERRVGEMKSNFVSSVSHELRTPVASMQLMAENLDTGAVTDESRKREYHRLIAEECRRLGSLIENVLDFSRIEQGRKTYRFAETNAAALVRDAVKVVQPRAEARRQRITAACEEVEPVCDGFAVQQALVNLLDNAVKFSPEEKAIAVTLRRRGADAWEISVTDEGTGVPPAERERIFERFYRAGSELTRETQGTGIGLSIVKHIVEAHGGSVEVANAKAGGARFTLVFPMEAQP